MKNTILLDVQEYLENAYPSLTDTEIDLIAGDVSRRWDYGLLIDSVDNKCRELVVNVMAFVNMGELDYEKIDDVEKKKASAMLGVLNKYQTKQTPIPEEVLGYNKNWR